MTPLVDTPLALLKIAALIEAQFKTPTVWSQLARLPMPGVIPDPTPDNLTIYADITPDGLTLSPSPTPHTVFAILITPTPHHLLLSAPGPQAAGLSRPAQEQALT
ncbi:hypothetical protein UFOVP706_54 [uncultured Caudovirales phage]|uniref:Uncharacterized protein n=1 Tax=uncultured Caudovirales phage TaxID=2100421 RepID=A0A6J5NK29_9CAUD|nr:hypothetical protein UFOVP706_54 [uncultured Caudovirales phage]